MTSDLPATAAAVPGSRRRPRRFTVSIFGGIVGGIEREGRRRLARQHWVVSICSGARTYVPEGIEVDFSGFGLFGGLDERGRDVPAPPGAPVLHVRTYSLFGGTDLWRVPSGAKGTLKELRRAAKNAERGEQP